MRRRMCHSTVLGRVKRCGPRHARLRLRVAPVPPLRGAFDVACAPWLLEVSGRRASRGVDARLRRVERRARQLRLLERSLRAQRSNPSAAWIGSSLRSSQRRRDQPLVRRAAGESNSREAQDCGTPFVPTPSEGHGKRRGQTSPKAAAERRAATRRRSRAWRAEVDRIAAPRGMAAPLWSGAAIHQTRSSSRPRLCERRSLRRGAYDRRDYRTSHRMADRRGDRRRDRRLSAALAVPPLDQGDRLRAHRLRRREGRRQRRRFRHSGPARDHAGRHDGDAHRGERGATAQALITKNRMRVDRHRRILRQGRLVARGGRAAPPQTLGRRTLEPDGRATCSRAASPRRCAPSPRR